MNSWAKVLFLLVCSGAIVLVILQRDTIAQLRSKVQQHEAEPRITEPAQPLSATISDSLAPDENEHRELLRLRNEVTNLRRTSNEQRSDIEAASNTLQTLSAARRSDSTKLRQVQRENRKLLAEREDHPRPPGVPRQGAWVGIVMQEASTLAAVVGSDHGVVVSDVLKGGPGERAKLKELDVILKVDGQEITGTADLKSLLAQKTVGHPMLLEILRNKVLINVEVTPREWPQ
jgi:C-terminal processing protease CtpA/Prc